MRIIMCIITIVFLFGCTPPDNTDKNIPPIDKDNTNIYPESDEDITPEEPEEPTIPKIEYEEYSGEIPHIFIHALIAYPEIKNSAGRMVFDNDCINVTEFKNMLNELYANGYSLIDIHDTFYEDEDGKLKLHETVSIPKGRKPVIISVDDVVYDYKKRNSGMVDFLDIDTNNNIITGTYREDGTIDYADDNEFIPILEEFIAEAPEFSSNNARFTLAMTGFAGVFGYRTESGSTIRDEEIEKAKKIANRLKELGYTFASHSYGHRDITKHSYESLKKDLTKFRDEVTPIVGDVNVYIYPYGKLVKPGESKYSLMQEFGFDLFASVSHFFYSREYDDGKSLYMTRVAVDGYSLRNYRDTLLPLFDVDKVIDKPNRP